MPKRTVTERSLIEEDKKLLAEKVFNPALAMITPEEITVAKKAKMAANAIMEKRLENANKRALMNQERNRRDRFIAEGKIKVSPETRKEFVELLKLRRENPKTVRDFKDTDKERRGLKEALDVTPPTETPGSSSQKNLQLELSLKERRKRQLENLFRR